MPHPYYENDQEQRERSTPKYGPADFGSLDDVVNNAVQFGTRVGGEVLSAIAEALQDVGRSVPIAAQLPKADDLTLYRRRLDRKLASSFGGYLAMSIVGGILTTGFLIATITMAALSGAAPSAPGTLMEYKSVFDILATVFAPVSVGCGVLFGVGVGYAGYFSRLRKYLRSMRGWQASLTELSRDTVLPPKRVRKDLRKAVAGGQMGNALYDTDTDTLYLDGGLYQPQPEPVAQPEPTHLTEQEQFQIKGIEFLGYLRGCRGKLHRDAEEELQTMQNTCSAIMGFIATHPEQLPRVRRFSEYYIPTTRKLLDTALGLAGTDTANALTIRRDITGILHTLNTAYAKLYDTLLQDVSLDISAEIDTLETMLSQDGLRGDFHSDFGTKLS